MATKNFNQMDLENMVSRAQVVNAASVKSTHAINQLDGDFDPSIGCQYGALVVPTTAVTGTNSMQIAVIQADEVTLTTNKKVIALSPAALALEADVPVVVEIPEGSISRKFIGIEYTFGGTSVTVNAWIAPIKSIANNPHFNSPVTTIAEL